MGHQFSTPENVYEMVVGASSVKELTTVLSGITMDPWELAKYKADMLVHHYKELPFPPNIVKIIATYIRCNPFEKGDKFGDYRLFYNNAPNIQALCWMDASDPWRPEYKPACTACLRICHNIERGGCIMQPFGRGSIPACEVHGFGMGICLFCRKRGVEDIRYDLCKPCSFIALPEDPEITWDDWKATDRMSDDIATGTYQKQVEVFKKEAHLGHNGFKLFNRSIENNKSNKFVLHVVEKRKKLHK